MKPQSRFNLWYWIAAFVAILGIQYYASIAQRVANIPYSQFQQLVRDGKVAEAGVSDRFVQGTLKEPLPGGETRFATTRVEPEIAEELDRYGVRYTGRIESTLFRDLLSLFLPILLFVGVWFYLGRRLAGAQGGLMQIGKSKAKVYVEADTGVTFKDVAGVDEANPKTGNRDGYVLELTERHDLPQATRFDWNLLLVCGDPTKDSGTYFGGFPKEKVSPISCPDNVAFDKAGNLWISTDGNALESNDGLYAVTTEGDTRGELKCFLTVPAGAETCGPIVTDERVMVNVQHPGETDDATFEKQTSHWPEGGKSTPRPAVVVVWKKDGNIGVDKK